MSWVCAPAPCPVIVGNLLLFCDNHLSVLNTAWLAPALAAGPGAFGDGGRGRRTGFAGGFGGLRTEPPLGRLAL